MVASDVGELTRRSILYGDMFSSNHPFAILGVGFALKRCFAKGVGVVSDKIHPFHKIQPYLSEVDVDVCQG